MIVISQWIDVARTHCVLVDLDGTGNAALLNFDHLPTQAEVQAQADVLLAARSDATDAAALQAAMNDALQGVI